MDFIQELFQYRFLSNAFFASLLAGLACGVVGTYIISRRLLFMSGGITHASFGGIGIAYYFGMNPVLGALIFAVFSALGIEAFSQRGNLREDSAIGILWSLGMAIGAIFIFMTPGYAPNLMSFLFGNILIVSQTDIWLLLGLDIVVLLMFTVFYRQIVYTAFDRQYARTQKMPVDMIGYAMMVLIAVTIVLNIRVAGIVLLISLLTIPPTIANLFTRSYLWMTVAAVCIAVAGTLIGLYVSYLTNIPSGAATVFSLAIIFLVMKAVSVLRRKRMRYRC